MARPFVPQIHSLVKYRRSDGRWVGAIVTGVIDEFIVSLRIGHSLFLEEVNRMSRKSDLDVWDLSSLYKGQRDVTRAEDWGWWF